MTSVLNEEDMVSNDNLQISAKFDAQKLSVVHIVLKSNQK